MKRLPIAFALLSLLAVPFSVNAQDWEANPGSDEWGEASNWSTGAVPSGSSSIATFATSSVTDISISTAQGPTSYSVGYFALGPGADAFTFTIASGMDLTIHAGVANESGHDQTFIIEGTLTAASGSDFDKKTIFETTGGGTMAFYSNATVTDSEVVNDANVELHGGSNFSLGSLSGTGALISYDDSDLTVGALDKDDTYAGSLASDTGSTMSLTKIGSGTWKLSGDNSYTGGTFLTEGTLEVGSDTATGVGDITITGGTLAYTDGVTQSNNVILETDGTFDVSSGTATQAGALGESGGSYGLTKTGDGTLILTGANTYGGGTTISEGTLQIGDGGTTGLLAGDVINDTTLVFNHSGDTAFTGVISGSGTLTKEGDGTLVFTGNNTFTGKTTISAGTLQLGDSSTTGSLDGDVANDGTLAFDHSDTSFTFTGVISGSGGVTQNGSGVLSLTGANTFTGDVTINSGQILVSSATEFSENTIVNNIADGLDLNGFDTTVGGLSGSGDLALGSRTLTVGGNGDDTTYSGVLSGTGALTKEGDGTLILDGANTYSGGTIISEGTLQISDDGSVTGDITDDGKLAFDTSSTIVFSNIVSGSGSLVKEGSGIVVLAGDSTYSGGTTISGGTLYLGFETTTGSITGNVVNDGTLIFNRTDDIVFDGVISGTGDVKKESAGTVELTAASTFSGETVIDKGTIKLGNALALQNSTVSLGVDNGLDLNGYNATLGGLAGSGNLSDLAVQLTVGGNDDSTEYSGSLSGLDMIVEKQGTGTWTLSGTNHDFRELKITDGDVTFDDADGTIETLFGHSSSLVTFQNGTVLSVTNAYDGGPLTVTGLGTDVAISDLSSYNTLEVLDGGNLTAASMDFDNESVTINGGTLIVESLQDTGSGGTLAISDPTDGTALIFDLDDDSEFDGPISDSAGGSGSLLKTGAGALTLTAANTYSGTTTISEGQIVLGKATALQNSTVSIGVADGLDLNGHNATLGSLAGSGDLALGSQTLSMGGNGDDTTYTGVLSGPGSLTKEGDGTLTLSGASTFTGTTTINAGQIILGNALALQTSTVSIGVANGLDLNSLDATLGGLAGSGDLALGSQTLTVGGNDDDTTYTGVLSGPGGLTKEGSGTLTLGGNNTFTGDTIINAGKILDTTSERDALAYSTVTLNVDNGLDLSNEGFVLGALAGSGNLTASSSAYLILGIDGSNDASTTYSGTLSGDISVGMEGSGTWTLTGIGHEITEFVVGNGAVVFDGATGTIGQILENDGGLNWTNGANMTVTGDFDADNVVIEDGASLTTGVFTVDSGSVMVNGGALTVAGLNASNSTTIQITDPDGGTALTFDLTADTTLESVIADSIGGSGSILKTGNYNLVVTSENTFTGTTTIDAGTLTIVTDLALQNSTVDIEVDGGLVIETSFPTLGGLSGSGNLDLEALPTVGGNGESTVYSGVLSGLGGLTKAGSGVLTLSGSSSYTYDTIVNAGTLIVDGSIASSVLTTVNSGGTLGGSGTVGDLLIADGGILSPGNSPGTLSAGDTTWNGGGSYVFEINDATGSSGTNWDLLDISGMLTINSTAGNPFTISVNSLTMDNIAGLAQNFDPTQSYSWLIASTTGGIGGFDAGNFTIDSSGFQNAPGSSLFSVSSDGSQLSLVYTAVPEPGGYGIAIAIVLGILITARRKRLALQSQPEILT